MPPPEIISWLEVAANAAKIIALLIGGIWGVFLFFSLRKWSRARIELENLLVTGRKTEQEIKKTEQEIRKLAADIKKAELESFQQAVLHLSMKTSQEKIPDDDARYVFATVEIENKGNRNTIISFEQKKPLAVRSVDLTSSGEPAYGEVRRFAVSMGRGDDVQGGWVIRTGSLQQIPFCVRFDKPGLYQFSFQAALDAEERDRSSELGKQTGDWWVMTYVLVA